MDRGAARRWLKKAAEANHAGAQFNLGLAYAQRATTQERRDKAFTWLKRAADNGDAETRAAVAEALLLLLEHQPKERPENPYK